MSPDGSDENDDVIVLISFRCLFWQMYIFINYKKMIAIILRKNSIFWVPYVESILNNKYHTWIISIEVSKASNYICWMINWFIPC